MQTAKPSIITFYLIADRPLAHGPLMSSQVLLRPFAIPCGVPHLKVPNGCKASLDWGEVKNSPGASPKVAASFQSNTEVKSAHLRCRNSLGSLGFGLLYCSATCDAPELWHYSSPLSMEVMRHKSALDSFDHFNQ